MIETDRLVAAEVTHNEDAVDRAVRPRVLADYVGQPVAREQMEIFVAAARGRKEALGGHHRAHRVGGRWANADLEDVENG